MSKQSIIVPLFKEKNKISCDNYRSVNLLSHCRKLTANVILQRSIRQRTEKIVGEAHAARAGRACARWISCSA